MAKSGTVGTRLLGTALAVPLSRVVSKKLTTSWRRTTGTEPPDRKGRAEEAHWSEVLMWTALSSMAVVGVKLLAERGAVEVYRFFAGQHPPGHDPVDRRIARARSRERVKAELAAGNEALTRGRTT